MAWLIEFESAAKKDLAKLDKPVAKRITAFLRERLCRMEDPRSIGEALHGAKLGEFWKYRVGGYRLICKLEDTRLTILVVRVGHRREVYR